MESHRTRDLIVTFALTCGVALVVIWPQIADPFLRHDDFPALLGDEEEFYIKTLDEGRWLNYWWIARPFLWSSQVNFLLYFAGWSLFSAAFAVNALKTNNIFWKLALSTLILLTPQAFEISRWFNTLVPGVWLLAVYAVLCIYLPWTWSIALLLLGSPLAFSAYTTYPFVMLAVLMTKHDLPRTMTNYVIIVVVFIISFALSLGAAYSLNYWYHGYFGIDVGDWRQPNPAKSIDDIVENFALIKKFIIRLMQRYGMGKLEVGFTIYAVAVIAFVGLFYRDRRAALFAITPIALGLGLLVMHALTSGVFFPVRSTIFVWMSVSYAFAMCGILYSQKIVLPAIVGVLSVATTVFLGYHSNGAYSLLRTWQAATADIASTVPEDVTQIVIYGERHGIDGGYTAIIQSERGVSGRFQYLTGIPTISCFQEAGICDDFEPPFDVYAQYDDIFMLQDGDIFYVRIPQLTALGP